MAKVRTIPQIVNMFRETDPNTPICEKMLRRLVKNNILPHADIGTKVLLDYDVVCDFFAGKNVN